MTRKQLIKAINDNEDAWSCPEYSCDMPEEEGNTGECCWKCAEKQLKKYEDKIRADAIDEYKNALHTKYKENKDFAYSVWEGYIYKYDAMANLDLEEIYEIAEQLKEKKNG